MPPAVDPRMARRRGGRGREGGGARSMKRPAARGTFGSEVRALLTPPQRPAARGRSGGCGAVSVSSDASHRCAGRLGGCSVFFVPSDVPPRRAQGVRVIVACSSSRRMWGSSPPKHKRQVTSPCRARGVRAVLRSANYANPPSTPRTRGVRVRSCCMDGSNRASTPRARGVREREYAEAVGRLKQRPARLGFERSALRTATLRYSNAPCAWGSSSSR